MLGLGSGSTLYPARKSLMFPHTFTVQRMLHGIGFQRGRISNTIKIETASAPAQNKGPIMCFVPFSCC